MLDLTIVMDPAEVQARIENDLRREMAEKGFDLKLSELVSADEDGAVFRISVAYRLSLAESLTEEDLREIQNEIDAAGEEPAE